MSGAKENVPRASGRCGHRAVLVYGSGRTGQKRMRIGTHGSGIEAGNNPNGVTADGQAPGRWRGVRDGRVLAPEVVPVEIRKVDDDAKAWVEDRRYLFRPPVEDVPVAVIDIMGSHERLVDTK